MIPAKPRILFFNPVRHAVAAYEALKAVADPEVVTSKSRQQFFADLNNKYHNIRAIYRTSASGAVCCLTWLFRPLMYCYPSLTRT